MQFSLRFLFQVMTTLAVVLGASLLLPRWFSELLAGAVWIVVAGILVTGIVYAKGDRRAFCIGGTLGLASMWTGSGGFLMQGIQDFRNVLLSEVSLHWETGILLDLAAQLILAWGMGTLCVKAKRYFEENGDIAED